MATSSKSVLTDKLVPILLVASILMAFAVGALWQKVSFLEKGGTAVAGAQVADAVPAGDAAAQPAAPTEPYSKMDESVADKVVSVDALRHVRGGSDADVFLIEYSDYECPFCQRFHPTAQQALDEYGDQLAWSLNHFPLEFIHPKAKPAAMAAECVAELGGEEAFWEFSDLVFEDQETNLADLPATAEKVGVSADAVQTCLDSEKYADVVQQQYDEGTAVGVSGTPATIVVNRDGDAWFVAGAVGYDILKAAIDEALGS